MTEESIKSLMVDVKSDVEFAQAISNSLVQENTADLDELMREIQNSIVNNPNKDDATIEYYLLQLTNALYFLNTRCENFAFYEDITKANARLKYNEMYSENQLLHAQDPKKPTQNDNQLYAELNSVDENTINIIYSRSVKIIKGKLDAASEMVRTLSKLLSVHMSNANSTSMARKLYE